MSYETKELKGWDLAKEAMRCPLAAEARAVLGLNDKQFSKLIGISTAKYWRWASGESEPSLAEKILIVRCLDIAKKKGYLHKSGDEY